MVNALFFLRPVGKQKQLLDTAEAFNLWDILKAKYIHAERMLLWRNFAHDRDLVRHLETHLKDLSKDIFLLEKELEKYGVRGPDKNRTEVKTAANAEVIRDEYIAQDYFIFLQESIEMLLRAFRTSATNDSVRALFQQLLRKTVGQIDSFGKYIKAKGWLEEPPYYPNVPAESAEQLDTGEAFHLWEHLTFRYDNIHQTDFYYTLAHDVDFKMILKTGLQAVLQKQAKMLEKELVHFGIPLPKRPTHTLSVPRNPQLTQMVGDDHMFRIILTGMAGAASVHGQALKQCSTNDRVRSIFKELLFSEVNLLDRLMKFGKMKGWLHPAPKYRLQ